jgi:diguanylate cyclase (GGDEF)-like protein
MSAAKPKHPPALPLRIILAAPYAFLILLTVSAVGYVSYTSGRSAVNDVVRQLRQQIAAQIEQHLRSFLSTPHQLDAVNAALFQSGELDPTDATDLQAHFLTQVQLNPSITSIYFGNLQGGIVGSGREGPQGALYVYETDGFQAGVFRKYSVDADGQRLALLTQIANFDARSRAWYRGAIASGQPSWSEVYILFTGQDMAIAASRPVYDAQGNPLGVVSVDLFLAHLSNFLRSLEISAAGQSFIIQRNGLLIATSTTEPLVSPPGIDGTISRLPATSSQSPLIRAAAQAILDAYGDFERLPTTEQTLEFNLQGQRHFVLLRALHDAAGLDWFIVIVIPEADFMGQIEATNRSTALIVLIAMLGAILIGIAISYRINRRIGEFIDSARALAAGNWTAIGVGHSRIAEIATLGEAFNQMSQRLHQSLENLTVLNRIGHAVASNLEFDQVLQTLYEQCQTVLPVSVFYVAIYDEQTHTIYHPFLIDNGQRIPVQPRDIRTAPGLTGAVILDKRTLYIPDVDDPEVVARYQMFQTSADATLSYVGVPLVVRERVVGVISMQSYQADAYQPGQINLFEIIADRVASAVEHGRLFAAIQSNARSLELLNEITRAALEAHDIDSMLQTVADRLGALFNADGCFITRWDEDQQRAYPAAAAKSQGQQYREMAANPQEPTLTAAALQAGRPLAVPDVAHSPYLSPHLAAQYSTKALLGLPLVAGDQKLGAALLTFEQTREFSAQDLALGQLVAAQIALAVAKSDLVVTDYLTHVFNRRGLIDLGNRELDRAHRYASPLSAILFDIDHFKVINDQHGHDVGDQVLKVIAQRARQNVRVADTIGRYGGEEFIILLPETNLEQAGLLAERLRLAIGGAPIPTTVGALAATISIGVASLNPSLPNLDALIKAADDAMYAAKQAGRNQVKVAA